MNGQVTSFQADVMIFFLGGIWMAVLIIMRQGGRR